MSTYDIYREIEPRTPLEDISDSKSVRQYIQQQQVSESEMGSTMNDTHGFQRSTMNDQFSTLYMTSTQFQSKQEKLPNRQIRDDYKFKSVHQYNINEDLKRYGRKTLLEMDIMGRSGAKESHQQEKDYA